MVTITRRDGKLVALSDNLRPTAERLAQGDVQAVLLPDGDLVVSRALSQTEMMARDGGLGDEVARLLPAAAWFAVQGEVGQITRRPMAAVGEVAIAARRRLARVHEAVGTDCFSALLDVCVFDIPLTVQRRPLFRAALHALAGWMQQSGLLLQDPATRGAPPARIDDDLAQKPGTPKTPRSEDQGV